MTVSGIVLVADCDPVMVIVRSVRRVSRMEADMPNSLAAVSSDALVLGSTQEPSPLAVNATLPRCRIPATTFSTSSSSASDTPRLLSASRT